MKLIEQLNEGFNVVMGVLNRAEADIKTLEDIFDKAVADFAEHDDIEKVITDVMNIAEQNEDTKWIVDIGTDILRIIAAIKVRLANL